MGLAFAVGLSLFRSFTLQAFNIEMHTDLEQADFLTSFSAFYDMVTMLMTKGLVWLFLLASIRSSLYLLWEIISAFGRLTLFRKLTELLYRAFLWIQKTIPRQFGYFNTQTWPKGIVDLVTKFCLCFEFCSFFSC